MELTIYWTAFARERLVDIFEYHKIKASPRVANKLVTAIVKHTLGLEHNPESGQIEQTIPATPYSCRYLVIKSYKILYQVNDKQERIEILHIFDVRQNPSKIKDF